jgi:hypothetical protein
MSLDLELSVYGISYFLNFPCGGRDEATSLYRAGMKDFAAGRLPALSFFVEAITNVIPVVITIYLILN